MRKLSMALTAAAGFALVAGTAAVPAQTQVRLNINVGPPTYYQPYYGNYYGYGTRPYSSPYYGANPLPGYNTYGYPYYTPYSYRSDRYDYHGYYGR